MVSYLLDLPEEDEEEKERPEINTSDSLWGETGTTKPSTVTTQQILLRRDYCCSDYILYFTPACIILYLHTIVNTALILLILTVVLLN